MHRMITEGDAVRVLTAGPCPMFNRAMSIRPHFLTISFTTDRQWSSSSASPMMGVHRLPFPVTRSAVWSSSFLRRAVTKMSLLCRLSATATALPMPDDAPVMRIALFVYSMASLRYLGTIAVGTIA